MSKVLMKRFEQAESRKQQWQTTYDEVAEIVLPRRSTFYEKAKGEHRNGESQVFDSTAIMGLQKFASNLQSSIFPPFEQWIGLTPAQALLAQDGSNEDELRKQLEKITQVMFAHINNSNFDVQIAEAFLDLGIGTAALLIQKGTQGRALQFQCVPIAELYLEEGANGSVGAVYRKHKMPARVIKDTWPDAEIGPQLQEKIDKKPDGDIEFVEGTIERKITVDRLVNGKAVEVEIDGFYYFVMEKKSGELIVERESASSPWVVFRYSVTPGEIYGRGPAMNVFADIKTLNKTKELVLKNASLAVAGAYTVADDGVINVNNIRIRPGALIPVAANAGGVQGPTIAPLPRTGNFDVAQLVTEDMRNSINEAMLADPLGPIDTPVRTATEVAFRQQELAKRTGSAFGRLQFELITPLINRILFLLEEQGLIDLSGFRVDGETIAIDHKSPLAQAKSSREFTAMQQWVEVLTANFGPQVALLLTDVDAFAKLAAKQIGAPAEVARGEESKEEIQALVAQFLASQQQGGGEA